ncbi:hypothetical protein F5Y17DRAFT_116016 [Xylariaceae sp. FL0594]|nr:hypothetical protein F5Y17DRAFT_116016 [Xylariaceae sp. FL0594]
MGAQQPYKYELSRGDSDLPDKGFDPKAVTRASWEVKPKKPKRKGPLMSFNQHPDSHVVPSVRKYNFPLMSGATKWWIKWTRYIQLVLRVLELIAGAGLLTLMILISNVTPLTAWILRIAPGVILLCTAYAIVHLARPARARPPGSSAAYQVFAALTDLAALPFYAFGAITVTHQGGMWDTILSNKTVLPAFITSEYLTLITAAGLHTVSLAISVYLALMFRRIAHLPPDMNPLESNLTSRVARHKRNKSSLTSQYTSSSENIKRLSTPLEEHRRSGAPYEELSRPPSIPFMHTRSGSGDSLVSSQRDPRVDLPSRQYQVTPGNSPRNSVAVAPDQQKRISTPSNNTPRLAQRGSYAEVPLRETVSPMSSPSRPHSAVVNVHQPINASPTRIAKFTESWYASESLVSRTQQRQQRAMNPAEQRVNVVAERTRAYEALSQRYGGDDDDDDSDEENEGGSDGENNNNATRRRLRAGSDFEDDDDDEDEDGPINVSGNIHPNPLRLNPLLPTPPKNRQKTPIVRVREAQAPAVAAKSVLMEMSTNRRSVGGDGGSNRNGNNNHGGIAKTNHSSDSVGRDNGGGGGPARKPTVLETLGRVRGAKVRGKRNPSIQADGDFYSKPYGELRSATPPIMYGGEGDEALKRERDSGARGGGRQVSSGNDYDFGGGGGANSGYRRKVSGRAAEEGMAGPAATVGRYSRYSVLNE